MKFNLKPFRKGFKLNKENEIPSLLSFTLKIIGWLLHLFGVSDQVKLELHRYSSLLAEIAKHRGTAGLIIYLKDIRSALLIYLAGEYPAKRIPGVKITQDGFPKDLSPFKVYLSRSTPDPQHNRVGLRMLLTLLYCTRALAKGKAPNTDSITRPGKEPKNSYVDQRRSFWKALGYHRKFSKAPRSTTFKNYHMTSKSGPNGLALITAIQDLSLIKDNPTLYNSICEVGGEKLRSRMDGLLSQWDWLISRYPRYPAQRLRKLSWFPDKENKVRIVAILDYFSQAALFPLHSWLYRMLKRIPQDCTFDQGSFKAKIEGWDVFYSIDLTNATDRFPIYFISNLLRGLLPDSWVDSWEYIMVGLPFSFKPSSKTLSLCYSVGTPMGAYTSWAGFAIAHHYIMFLACFYLGKDWKDSRYVLLGDDILIGDQDLANKYKELISGLGVEFSPLKTHESRTLCEFAKRLFFRGEEITPFPIHAVRVANKFYNLLPVLYGEKKKDWDFGEELSLVIMSYYQYVKGFNSSKSREFYHKSAVSEKIMLYMKGEVPAIHVIQAVYRQLQLPPPKLREALARNAILHAVKGLFEASDPMTSSESKSKGKPLGLLAETLTMRLTDSYDDMIVIWACDNISNIPVLNVYGQISEMYIKLKKQGKDMIKDEGYWPLFLKTVGLPLSDAVFVERQKDRLAKGASQVAFRILDSVKHIEKRRAEIAKKGSWTSFFYDDEDIPAAYLSKKLK